MAIFEDLGRKVDQELDRLRDFLEEEVKPTTQRKAVAALRKASERLAAAAKEIEARAKKKSSK